MFTSQFRPYQTIILWLSIFYSFSFTDAADYVDDGGNVASGNDCDGVFVESAQPHNCIAFDDNSDPIPLSPAPTLQPVQESSPSPDDTTIACERIPAANDPCITISNFETLQNIMEREAGVKVFCPFSVDKPAEDYIFITSDIELICSVPHLCRIRGRGRHFVIKGSSTKVFVQGFAFEGATNRAVHIKTGTSHIQSFCNNVFLDNTGSTRGLGLLADPLTRTEVSHCRFEQNESSDMGGGIFNRGNMLVVNSVFVDNAGRGGG